MTTMIACISPIEYNISETLNTINYASRARRIKNSVQKNQAEVGWDDIDYLRNTVTKLRTKIAGLEQEGPREPRVRAGNDNSDNEAILQREVFELQDKLSDLEDEFSHVSREGIGEETRYSRIRGLLGSERPLVGCLAWVVLYMQARIADPLLAPGPVLP